MTNLKSSTAGPDFITIGVEHVHVTHCPVTATVTPTPTFTPTITPTAEPPFCPATTLSTYAVTITVTVGKGTTTSQNPANLYPPIFIRPDEVSISSAGLGITQIVTGDSTATGYSGVNETIELTITGRYRISPNGMNDSYWYRVQFMYSGAARVGWITQSDMNTILNNAASISCPNDPSLLAEQDREGNLAFAFRYDGNSPATRLYYAPVRGNIHLQSLSGRNDRIVCVTAYAVNPTVLGGGVFVQAHRWDSESNRLEGWLFNNDPDNSAVGEILDTSTLADLMSRVPDRTADYGGRFETKLAEGKLPTWTMPPKFTFYPVSVAATCAATNQTIDGIGVPFDQGLYGQPGYHTGVDFFAPDGSSVYSIGENGLVVGIGASLFDGGTGNIPRPGSSHDWGSAVLNAGDSGYAFAVIIRYGHLYVLYGHLRELDPDIFIGAPVQAGDRLGSIGSFNDPHVHIEIRNFVNPIPGGGLQATPMRQFGFTSFASVGNLYSPTVLREGVDSDTSINQNEERCVMSLKELYHWQRAVRAAFGFLGCWQALGLALYSYGVILARQCAPSRVAEKLPLIGKANTVQRRLERWLDNERIDWQACCRAWSRWVLSHYRDQRLILLVDETKLSDRLSAMVVGVAYRGCCIPLAFWCYPPKQWPMRQVELITTLLNWIAPAIPSGVIPLVQADRGIGTSPELLRAIVNLGWHLLVRVQKNTRLRREATPDCPLASLVTQAGQTWSGRGQVFKKAGWLDCRVLVLWGQKYRESWCLVTNCPDISGWDYGMRYWQEASFRDLKSDGWQWQASRIWTPDHANRLLLVLALAYAWVLTLGTLVMTDADLARVVTKGRQPTYSIFRLGLRLWELFMGQVSAVLRHLTHDYLCFLPHFPDTLESVGV